MRTLILLIFFLPGIVLSGQSRPLHADIVVARDGSGDFTTLTEAVESLPMYTYERVVIYLKPGIYEEKIRIEQNHISLVGAGPEETIIRYDQLREDWIDDPDPIGPAVVNIHADDVILRDLSVINTQPETGVHAFAIYGTGTRTILYNCRVISRGGDTVSLWNYKAGRYYHANCYFEGGVDFVCPRGWCFIRDSRFYEVRETHTLWHAGITDERQRLVIRNSSFDGVPGFQLARHHYEAQFFLLNCRYSENMADEPILHVTYPGQPERNRPYFWGDRYYFSQSDKAGEPFSWLQDNLDDSGVPSDSITAAWTFDHTWNPEDSTALVPYRAVRDGKDLILFFSEPVTVRGTPTLRSPTGQEWTFAEGRGRTMIRFHGPKVSGQNSDSTFEVFQGSLVPTKAYLADRACPGRLTLPLDK